MKKYDVIVLGVGGIGSAVCYAAAQKGLKVLGLEQFELGHSLGSSHGQTRVIRKAYFEAPEYVPWCERSYQLWRNLEKESQEQLMHLNGIAMFLNAQGGVKQGLLKSAQKFNISIESLSYETAQKRWPLFQAPQKSDIFFEPEAGYLLVEKCTQALREQAQKKGAELKDKTKVLKWEEKLGGVEVVTEKETFQCKKLIVTAGPWTHQMLDLGIQVHQVDTGWFPSLDGLDHSALPTWIMEKEERCYYGFPQLDARGVKASRHEPGEERTCPNAQQSSDEHFLADISQALQNFLPGLASTPSEKTVCYYSMTTDEKFILDFYPGSQKVLIGAGFSGHGFKFAPTIGEYLVSLALQEEPAVAGEFLRIGR